MRVKRFVFKELIKELSTKSVLILIGPRQVGKTFLMNQLKDYLTKKNKRTKYFNLEIPRDSRLFAKDIVELYDEITKNIDYLFIDEFHYLENASKLFKAIFDDTDLKIKIIASGSSSLEMHKHLKESLAGRKEEKVIYPLTYTEFKQTQKSFSEYLTYGGLPGLLHVKESNKKINLINNLLETYILKDIKGLIKEENISAFNNLLYLIADYQGQIVSTSSLANELRVDNKTVESYLNILEKTFVLYPLFSYSGNLSNELKKSKKYYIYDLGIRNAILNDFENLKNRKDKGIVYESCIHNYIRFKSPKNSELRFWRTKKGDEIDFVYLKNRKPYIIEVKSKLNSAETPKAFHKFINNYPNTQRAFVINENLEEKITLKNIDIEFIKLENLETNKTFNSIFSN